MVLAGLLVDLPDLLLGHLGGCDQSGERDLAREGADLAIVYLPDEESDAIETKGAIEAAGRRTLLLPGTVTSNEFCQAAVAETVKQLGAIDILVNNAAYQKNRDSIAEVSEEQFDRTFKTNIYGYFFMAKAALEYMKEGACIINTGSITGLEGESTLIDYASTKGAIHAFTKSLAQNLVKKKIRVNAVAPGPVWTPLNTAAKSPEDVAQFGADTPMGRPGQPEELAPTYVFLASNADSGFMTGEVISLLGGDVTAA